MFYVQGKFNFFKSGRGGVLSQLLPPFLPWLRTCGFIRTLFLFVHMKFDNLAKAGNIFPGFVRKEAIYSSKLKILSVSTPNTFCYLLFQILGNMSKKAERSKHHLKKNPPAFEQREVLLNNIDNSIDAQNFEYQNMQKMYLIKVPQGGAECHKDLTKI